ncbi:hypothetical protein CQA89_32415, partial [Klebsiella pneumoniae]
LRPWCCLFLPKLLSIILVWCKGPKEYGRIIRARFTAAEVCSRSWLAPVRMLFHTVFDHGAACSCRSC